MNDRDKAEAMVLGAALLCRRPEECPLQEIKALPRGGRYRAVIDLPDTQLFAIAATHDLCPHIYELLGNHCD